MIERKKLFLFLSFVLMISIGFVGAVDCEKVQDAIYKCGVGEETPGMNEPHYLFVKEFTDKGVILNSSTKGISPVLEVFDAWNLLDEEYQNYYVHISSLDLSGKEVVLIFDDSLQDGYVDVEEGDEDPVQCDQADDSFICQKGEFVGGDLEMIERSDNFVQFRVGRYLKEATSDRLVEGDVWEVENLNGEKILVIVDAIGLNNDESKVVIRIVEKDDYEEGDESAEVVCNNGCVLNDKCYSYGHRKRGQYCSDLEDKFVNQNEEGIVCENNFECKSNLCIDNQCIEQGFFKKIINWFKRIF